MKHHTLVYFEDDLTQSFGITDLEMLSKGFEKTYLFSENPVRNRKDLPGEVHVVESFLDWSRYNAKKYLLNNLMLVLNILYRELWSGKLKLNQLATAAKKICSNIYRADCVELYLQKLNIKPGETVFYSFWFYDCIFQAVIKRRHPDSLALIRTHGGDLFEDSATLNGRALLRYFQFKYTDLCIPISKMGAEYLQKLYPAFANKIKYSRLGTEDEGEAATLAPNEFVLVSCSHVRNVKRVHLIGEALMQIDFPVKWYHFGDPGNRDAADPYIGYFHQAIDKLKQKPNIECYIMGNLPVKKVLEFYTQNPVNALISTSSTEGIPVSMMEAISFGIPVIGTDVGGCREIITAQTGVLLNPEIGVQELAGEIAKFKNSELNTAVFRAGVRKFWNENFDRNKNYHELLGVIEKIEN